MKILKVTALDERPLPEVLVVAEVRVGLFGWTTRKVKFLGKPLSVDWLWCHENGDDFSSSIRRQLEAAARFAIGVKNAGLDGLLAES